MEVLFMNKFTKSMAAIAVSAMVAGPASAVEYSTTKATADFSGSGCKSDKGKDLQVFMDFLFGTGAPNTGFWQSTFFSFGDVLVDGEGPFIISKTGKTDADAPKEATMDLGGPEFDALEDEMAAYAEDTANCKKSIGVEAYNFDTQITMFTAKWSKNGDKVSVKMKAEGTYEDTKGKDKKAQLKVNAKNMERILVD
jgi:hypothetical protein